MGTILADIGGTHIRFAAPGSSGPDNIKKFAVADFGSLTEALAAYSEDKGTLYIATAAWP